MKKMAQTILYYPNINIKDGQWLRNALLYWDNISSIVPHKEYEAFSPDLLFLKNSKVYEAIYPQDLFNSEFATDFCNTTIKRIRDFKKNDSKKLSLEEKKAWIHKAKIHAEVLYELEHDRNLSPWISQHLFEMECSNHQQAKNWMEISDPIAQIYMRTLAEFSIKCSPKDIVLGTDKLSDNQEVYCPATDKISNQCCHLNIINCLPQPSMETSFEDILEFKLRRKDELEAFRKKIREFEENIYSSNSLEDIKHYENKFVESWGTYYSDYDKALKDSKIRFVLGNLCTLIAIPSIGNVLTKHIGQDFSDTIQLGAGLLQMGINYIDYRNKINPNKTDGGFSYIINAREVGLTLV